MENFVIIFFVCVIEMDLFKINFYVLFVNVWCLCILMCFGYLVF